MNCQIYRELFTSYLDGELSPVQRQKLEEHLKACQDCALLLSLSSELAGALRNIPELEPPAGLVSRLYRIPDLAAENRKKEIEKFGWKFWLNPGWQPVLAALTVVMVLLSFVFFTTPGRSVQKAVALELNRGYSLAQKMMVRTGLIKDKLDGYRQNILASLEAKNIIKSE